MISPDELVVDNFAGGGGASLGLERALGRPVDIAINHDPEAIAMHRANHPETEHLCQNIWQVDPRDAVRGRPVGLAWFSPDCSHHSKAKGGKPLKRNIRDLAWVVVHWAKLVRPRIIMLENVEEFKDWCPLDQHNKPIVDLKGQTFLKWVRELKKFGYKVEWRELRACDYGAPTIRKRLFLIARCDGEPIIWPQPTHGPGLIPYRTAAEIIDWSLPCPSIFLTKEEARRIGCKRPLVEATMKRIARGVFRFVIEAEEPFIVPVTHQGDIRVHGTSEPLRTVTTAKRGEFALVAPSIISVAHGYSGGRREYSAGEPLGTVTSGGVSRALVAPSLVGVGGRAAQSRPRGGDEPLATMTSKADVALVSAFLAQHNTGMTGHPAKAPVSTIVQKGCTQAVVAAHIDRPFGQSKGNAVDAPLGSTTAGGGGKSALVTSHMLKLRGTCKDGQPIEESAPAITAGGQHLAEVRAFLLKYYGSATGQDLKDPLHSATSRARFGLVMVQGEPWQIVDIGMRMLSPRELFRAQGFPDSYIIDPEVDGKPLTKTAQIRMCGNSVCPDVAAAIVQANAGAVEMRAAE